MFDIGKKSGGFRWQAKLRSLATHPSLQGLPFWVGSLLTGLAAVAYARAFHWISTVAERVSVASPWALLALTPLSFVAGWWLVHRFAPEAAGSGIPQVMAAHDLDHDRDNDPITRLLGLRTMVVKVISSLLCVLGGGAVGREGPTIQIAASIFHAIGSRAKAYWPRMSHRSWIIAGGAAGIASAFNTPLGGIVYAIEELSSASFGQFRSLLLTAVIIAGLMAQWMSGPYLYLGYPQLAPIDIGIVPPAIAVGIISGLGGGLFGVLLTRAIRWRSGIRSARSLAGVAIACGLGLALLAIMVNREALGPGNQVMANLLFGAERGEQSGLAVVRFVGSVLSYVSGCAGGIFAPSLSIGAAIGGELRSVFHSQNPNLVVLLGMIGFLTGVTRAPFTSFVLVLEMTDRHSAIFPMMVTAVTALTAARFLGGHSFYELMKDQYLERSLRARSP